MMWTLRGRASSWLLQHRICAAIAAIILAAAGIGLVLHPLTSVVVLSWTLVICAVGGALLAVVAAKSPATWLLAAASIAVALGLAAASIFWLREWIALFPYLTAAALIGGGIFTMWRLVCRAWPSQRNDVQTAPVPAATAAPEPTAAAPQPGKLSQRGGALLWAAHVLWVLAAFIAAVLVVVWPDAGLVVLGIACGVVLVYAAAKTLIWLGRARATGSRRGGAHPVVRLIAATTCCALVAAAGIGTAVANTQEDGVEDFYSWEGELPAAGQLLRTAAYDGEVPDGATAQRILYTTTDANGDVVLASAIVAIPDAPVEEGQVRTVLAWEHGTNGVAQDCAPSMTDSALSEYAIPGISRAIERGWVVVAPDYPGQGTSGAYPYMIGKGEGQSVLDAVRALGQLSDADAGTDVMIWGHSQGGHAALWAGELASSYAPELTVLGVAALSAASDPLALAKRLAASGSLGAELVSAYTLVPYSDTYSDVSLADSVTPAGEVLMRSFASRCLVSVGSYVSLGTAYATKLDRPLTTLDLDGAFVERLTENIATGIVPAPLFQGQGTSDEVVSIELQRNLTTSLCAAEGALLKPMNTRG